MNLCHVCDKRIHRHKHFGAQACSPCGAFFRRSIAERKTYQCRRENECEIKFDSRNVCRACRLRKCYEAGMHIKSTESPILPESSSNNNSPDLSSITMIETNVIISETIPSRQVLTSMNPNVSISFPILYRLHKGICDYLDTEKMFLNKELNSKVQENGLFLIKKSDLFRIQSASIPHIYSLLMEFFEPFNLLSSSQQILLLKSFAIKFWFLMKDYHTLKIFPNLKDTRLTVREGYAIDYNNTQHVKYFLSEFAKPAEHFNITVTWLKSSRELVNKYISRDFTEIEFTALAYIIFLMECEIFPNVEDHVFKQKELIFKEIYNYHVTSFDLEQGGIKFSNLFYLLDETMSFNKKLMEDLKLVKIFLHDFYDAWLDLDTSK